MVDFHHPFTPYAIQLQLMDTIYETLSNDDLKVGLFESPTGTGKTLSIIASTLTYLRNYHNSHLLNVSSRSGAGNGDDDDDDEPDWVNQNYYKNLIDDKLEVLQEYEDNLDNLKEKLHQHSISSQMLISNDDLNRNSKKRRKIQKINIEIDDDDLEYLPSNQLSNEGKTYGYDKDASLENKNNSISIEIQNLLSKLSSKNNHDNLNHDNLNNDNDNDKIKPILDYDQKTKIFFSSRTHSQLSQFISQLNLYLHNTYNNKDDKDDKDNKDNNNHLALNLLDNSFNLNNYHLKYLPIGSRLHLCINDNIKSLNNISLINDACLDLQNIPSDKSIDKKKNKLKSTLKNCSYYENSKDQNLVIKFRDLIFSDINDITQLNSLGKHLNVCPFYSIKNESNSIVDLISLPYQLLLIKNKHVNANLNLKNSIIIIDEAHNLIDTIINLNSITVSLSNIILIKNSLNLYLKKFIKKLNSYNRVNLIKLIKFLTILYNFINNKKNDPGFKIKPGLEINILDIFNEKSTGDLLNIYKLENYLNKSKIAYKIQKYINNVTGERNNTPLLFDLIEFLKVLSNPSKEGKIYFDFISKSKTEKDITINYMLLDPIETFKDIVLNCKKLILIGGTMEPMSDYVKYLFPYLDEKKQIKKFSCGHIVDRDNLNVFVVNSNNNNMKYDFSFLSRNNVNMLIGLLKSIIHITKSIPDGIVMFFPSYKYMDQVIGIWKAKERKSWDKLNEMKKIFYESSDSSDINKVLNDYSDHILNSDNNNNNNGGLLFSVVGGKMSEGINFSDSLARGILMIGLPFPNLFSGKLISRRKYIEDTVLKNGGDMKKAREESMNFYENICMRAVNQSVGRSIRHIKDYSSIYLIDHRYNQEKIQGKLSKWIRDRIITTKNEDEIVTLTREFFNKKR
ncbi:DNA helicase [Ascoidea rubescens DSM 1968]|uniref:ATP-dependent DNA helicase CHL1 n=1 Tax=Ascoidea rubescens DSM 1968 TaxID=1344418 RepID=A0A1D2VHT6_9ASCO|nr:DNA repair helicase [Ascoidea rubescens DSM 1968]ODV61162.1 DNA repair helicase [Ascoidea rubescens DSM 1968]